ncbi:MAG: tetratricopeptide repeat protein [Thermoanaerobaculaceae bacterium]|nr:tetratricopeptide repeat protein [Thermoanaerobaculaceae bacterium]MDI9620298.1 tetratricopeptide repeat protein [Acidobacteriota bacterium]NLH11401.1 tetratricopeptide repeat protein [Holophagae bacterium]HPW55773.1 tetratricopeptide repeat protein [Thermoanaerobaculaceae bacterium]
MRRLTRKQIKQDELIGLVDQGMNWLSQNSRQALLGLIGAIVVVMLVWGTRAILDSRGEAAGEALSKAIAIYAAPVGSAAPTDAKLKFATATERLAAAETAFSGVRSKYSWRAESRLARLYLARIAMDRNDKEQAIRELSELVRKSSADPVVRMAMLNLVRLRVEKGEGAQLAPDLEAMAAGKDPRLPRDVALWQLAQLREHDGNSEEASNLYRKLVSEFPDSPYRGDAAQRAGSAS